MLNFIYGRSSSGKTTELIRQIENDAKADKNIVLIVPEQFSFESEKNILLSLGDELAHKVSVFSFTALAEKITETYGGASKSVLSDADKILFMNKTLLSLKDELYIWRKYLSSTSFASKVVDMIGEFKVSAVFPEDLDNVCLKLPESALKEKIKALALVYRGYDAMMHGRFIDPADKLDKLYNDLLSNKFFQNKTVYIDAFKGYTGQQYRIIELILAQSDSLTVTALTNRTNKGEPDLFYNTSSAIENIKDAAKRHNVKVGYERFFEKPYYKNADILAVEQILSGEISENYSDGKNVTLCIAKSADDEVRFAAKNIRRLVREENYRYSDFVVIARDIEHYESAIEREFAANDISCFFDKKVPLTISPLYAFLESALSCASAFSSDELFRFLKTGLAGVFSETEINELENYVYLWNIDFSSWEKNWDMDPTGFSETKAEKEQQIKDTLERINSIRKRVVEPIVWLRRDLGDTVKSKSAALVRLLENCSSDKQLSALLEKIKTEFSPEDIDVLRQSWDSLMNVLDSMVKCFGDDVVSNNEYMDMFRISCETTTLGRTPQMLDEVLFGAADRICPSRPKIAFILGANQGVFPKFPENSSILNNNDRRLLIEAELKIKNKTLFQTIEENLLVYSSVTCPSEKLFITSNEVGVDGGVNTPSAFFAAIKENINSVTIVNEPSEGLNCENYPETKESAFRMLCDFAGNNREGTATLIDAVLTDESTKNQFYHIVDASSGFEKKLSPEKAKELYGKEIYLSATSFDMYHGCHFKYFCKNGLKTSIIQPAKLDVMQRGTIIHYVLEQFCNAHKEDIDSVDKETIVAETDKYLSEYFDSVKGSEFLFTAKFKFLLKNIKDGLIEVIERMVKEFAQSKFRPVQCEVKIGSKKTIPNVYFPFGDGNTFCFNGSIDRLDKWDSYIRIIDYKSGGKTFKMSDTLYGLNLQMLLYLYCVIRGGNPDFNTKKPAGGLYMPSKRDISKKGTTMSGIIAEKTEVIEAMEKDNNGVYIPVYKPKAASFIPESAFDVIFDYIEKLTSEMGESLHNGDISVNPIFDGKKSACYYCDYKSVCGKEDDNFRLMDKLKNEEVINMLRGEEENEI